MSSNLSSELPRRSPPLADQVVLVTGGARGLGAAIVRAFAREGARVVINYFHSRAAAEALAAELGERAIALPADVRDAAAVASMIQTAQSHFGAPVSTVVSNALVDYRFDPVARKTLENLSWTDYQAQLQGAVQAGLNLIQAARAGMREAGGGRFIAIGSNLVDHPVVPYHEYTTAKAALLGFVRNAAAELGPDGITVNLVAGGLIDRTDASAATSAEVFELIRSSTPLREVLKPEALADAVLLFASPWARSVSGQTLNVDGGLVMR